MFLKRIFWLKEFWYIYVIDKHNYVLHALDTVLELSTNYQFR